MAGGGGASKRYGSGGSAAGLATGFAIGSAAGGRTVFAAGGAIPASRIRSTASGSGAMSGPRAAGHEGRAAASPPVGRIACTVRFASIIRHTNCITRRFSGSVMCDAPAARATSVTPGSRAQASGTVPSPWLTPDAVGTPFTNVTAFGVFGSSPRMIDVRSLKNSVSTASPHPKNWASRVGSHRPSHVAAFLIASMSSLDMPTVPSFHGSIWYRADIDRSTSSRSAGHSNP